MIVRYFRITISSQACLGASRVYARAGCGGEGHVQEGAAISFVSLHKAISSLWSCGYFCCFGIVIDVCWYIFPALYISLAYLLSPSRSVSLEHFVSKTSSCHVFVTLSTPASRCRKSNNSTNTLSAKLGVAGGLKMVQWGTCWITSEYVPRASMSSMCLSMCLKTHCKETLLPEGIVGTTTP